MPTNRSLQETSPTKTPSPWSEITLAEVLRCLRDRWKTFLAVVVLVATPPIGWVWNTSPTYMASVKFLPNESEDSNIALGAALSQLGGLAALAGLTGIASASDQESMALLRSRQFAERFMREQNLMPLLFSERWDAAAGSWRKDLAPSDVPTMDDAWERFDRQIRRIHQDNRTRLVTLDILWKDRVAAARWANDLVEMANLEMRRRALMRADATVGALERELDKTSSVELRKAIFAMMEAQIRRRVLAETRQDFAFVVVDRATVPDADRIHRPRRMVLTLVSLVAGVLLAAVVIVAASGRPSQARR